MPKVIAAMRKVILQLHLIVALTAGIFIVILGVTGSIMAFEPEVDLLVPRIAYVTKRGIGFWRGNWTAKTQPASTARIGLIIRL